MTETCQTCLYWRESPHAPRMGKCLCKEVHDKLDPMVRVHWTAAGYHCAHYKPKNHETQVKNSSLP